MERTSPLYYCFDCESTHTVAFGEEYHGQWLAPHWARLAEGLEEKYERLNAPP